MKTIKCDRCGKEIPYKPPYLNCVNTQIIKPRVIMTTWDFVSQIAREVDLCEECQIKVYDYIFEYNSEDYNERIIKHDL